MLDWKDSRYGVGIILMCGRDACVPIGVGFLAEGLELVEFFSGGDETAFDAAFVGGQAVEDFGV